MTDQPTTFGKQARRLRMAADLNLGELAELLGVDVPIVSDLERDRLRPTVAFCVRLEGTLQAALLDHYGLRDNGLLAYLDRAALPSPGDRVVETEYGQRFHRAGPPMAEVCTGNFDPDAEDLNDPGVSVEDWRGLGQLWATRPPCAMHGLGCYYVSDECRPREANDGEAGR